MATRRAAREERERPAAPPDLLGYEGPGAGVPKGVNDFPTPPWGGRALPEKLLRPGELTGCVVGEPCANRGYLYRALQPYCGELWGRDVFDYGAGFPVFDYLSLNSSLRFGLDPLPPADWIITNPPFSWAAEFFEISWRRARKGVALLLRTQILESTDRFQRLFNELDPRQWTFAVFVERLPMVEHRVARISSATSYGWLVCWKEPQDPEFLLSRRHVPPCRDELERSDDYR
jgi:hypothetical protein